MTDQQTLPGLEPQFPYNTPAGKWIVKEGWTWSEYRGVWIHPDRPTVASQKDAVRLYFENDYPPF